MIKTLTVTINYTVPQKNIPNIFSCNLSKYFPI